MTRSLIVLGLLLVSSLASCAQVPQEAVELSATVGRDLGQVHQSHRALAQLYFTRIKRDIGRFVDEQYRPYMVRTTMADVKLTERIKDADPATAQAFMEKYTLMLTGKVDAFRRELTDNVSRQETEVLQSIDDAYQRLQNANAVVTGHLASVRKVFDAQDEVLRKANLEGLREKTGARLAGLSDKIGEWTDKVAAGEEKIENVLKALRDLTAPPSR